MLIDDFSRKDLVSNLGTQWRCVSDKVMGGISEASVTRDIRDGHSCMHLAGHVSLENEGGFVQASLDLAQEKDGLNASAYAGICLVARGNGEKYSVHLRTPDNDRPWQSYRAHFTAGSLWQRHYLPFSDFAAHRIDVGLDVTRLRRIGLVAIGRTFDANLALSELRFYGASN
jgi:hypothetical protein